MKQYQYDLAALILRITIGIMFLAHGLTKLLVFTPAGTAQFFASLGLPEFLAYLTIVFEIGGGICLVLGILVQIISWLTFLQMIVISFIHSSNGWSFGNAGGGWEYPAFMSLTALSLALIGSGRFTVLARIKNQKTIED
ncbi:DoxX family protein [Gilliamella apicola]|jgi:Predicted membrane protein|uniref:DoxX family protein n=1 Tax=Gilliamella apicola TaxID=1196095 RepID=A0A556RT03_9GAMM|nr:DoxX family protein [Gilliamella apicola]TSJ92037.1 DoxX family protein [Gilliamella apicola]